MKKYLLIVFILFSAPHYGQSLSKTSIIYEAKQQVVMNNGKSYQILIEKPFYEIADTTIQRHKQIGDDLLRLNRILILKNNNEHIKLIEWSKERIRFYQSKEIIDFDFEMKNFSGANMITKD
ncbi:hypothetical protein [Aquimarina mytili]|uniref:Uncharacterized protein n=1 Tax=Aquimarina mytili TaxID=874423 RepID=A0A936ZRU8_9FLAO|nr:hypothetical protein [Aquimarina mytili]MBL0683152.1 hypothetical protein [Aquimarina mytili]